MPRLLLPGLLLLLAACSDYGIKGPPDNPTGTTDGGATTDGGGDGGEVGDGGTTPTDDEQGDGGGTSDGDGGSTVDIPEFSDCGDAGLWEGQWWGSMPFTGESPLTDSSGRAYYATDYSMLDYSTVVTPDEGHIPSGYDKAYRVDLWLDATGPRFFLDIQSDDGVWIHLNGREIGHWGGAWQEEGCVNDLANCTEYVETPPIEITDELQVGSNLLAVRVSNAIDGSYMWVSPRCSDE